MSDTPNTVTGHTNEELIQRLKFTPCTYKVELWGYGGEYVMGTVERHIYDYFRQHRISVPDYAWGGDEFDDIPEDMRPFEPGCWYENDHMGHVSGVDRNSGTIQITNEKGEVVYRRELSDLDGCDVQLSTCEEVWVDEEPAGTVVYYGYSSEKGSFFEADIELTEPFDPEKLLINISDFDSNEIVVGVEYDGEELDNYGGNTTGKGSDHAFYIAGSNQGKGYERYRDMDDIKYKLTDWFTADVVPVRNGKYEVETSTGHTYQAVFNGIYWHNDWTPDEVLAVVKWRGVAYDPDEHFVREELDNIVAEIA
jgi:hypothetical protein